MNLRLRSRGNQPVTLGMAAAGLFWLCACGPAKTPDAGATPAPGGGAAAPQTGLVVEVSYSVMADVLHLTEEVSLWREGMPRTSYRAFEERFGLDATDRELLKKFAFARSELDERSRQGVTPPSFEAPFGAEGLFPSSTASLVDRFWQAIMATGEPAAVARALAGILEPADAEAVSAALLRIAPRAGQIIAGFGGYAKQAEEISRLLSGAQLTALVQAFAQFAGVDPRGVKLVVHPVWVPSEAPFEAVAYGDRILVALPEGKPVGPQQAALVAHEIGRRLLSRLPAETKALSTIRFIEKTGFGGEPFLFVEGLLDAFSHGIAAPLMAAGPGDVPPWPGDAARKKFSEKITPRLREALNGAARLDGVFALRAGELEAQVNPPRPADFVNAAMVIGEEDALTPFKSQVVRWTVWKFPPSKKYDYPRKLESVPGRSVLLILTPADLKALPDRFGGMPEIQGALEQAKGLMGKNAGVIVAAKRGSRGYVFVVAAHTPEAMKQVAKSFFALEGIPAEPVLVK